ncbi:cysteine proteinase [Saccharata proteae CBS 121410]|uniref:Cysteine proteinase n=1 Tax=Saccharata proteae CBS 121410 TaxID=1314787 RepID=A0A9P4HNK3_9PEZI|nr:cysteine proteinase [Saccharata proteae CBS 121410]
MALAKVDPGQEIVGRTASNGKLSARDFMTVLGDAAWLNDEIVNSFLASAVKRGQEKRGYGEAQHRAGAPPPFYAFSTNWMQVMLLSGPQEVVPWCKKQRINGKKMLETDLILMPICDGNHWRLVTLSGKSRTVRYYDSLYRDSLRHQYERYTNLALGWARANLGDDFVEAEWTVQLVNPAPQQQNGSDCGVFVCMTALSLLMGREITPTAYHNTVDMVAARRHIAAVLLNFAKSSDSFGFSGPHLTW